MARMPNNPALLVMYASFMIEARKDGQAARTQLQLAQKANPNVLDTYNIYVAQQLAKQLKRGESHVCLCLSALADSHCSPIHTTYVCMCDPHQWSCVLFHVSSCWPADGDGLDLLSYVEFQRNYLACVRNHKAALMTQRSFWNCLLRDTIAFKDLQVRGQ